MTRPGKFLAILALLAPVPPARADGYPPGEARARMAVPEGFGVKVFAAEPMVRQPVAACFDGRGRLWVIEYFQYPTPAGLKPVTVDQYLRTEYDRVPEPPPRGPRGADRIRILEDTDGDGQADKATTFAEGLNLATGLAVGHGGVFVGSAPYLLFYPDRDGDDRPDGDPEVRLAGFGMQDAHATLNSFTWGPDGWLYGAQGSTVTAKIRGIEFQQGIWRYHPRTKAFELFAEGGGNTWGLDFDLAGNAFGSSNGGFVAFHMVQGGSYWKGFAKHGPLHNPRTYGYFEALDYRGPKLGGHVTPGGIIYKGDAFPESFRGAFLGANLLSNAVYWHELSPKGSTFSARSGGTLLDAQDAWFRPIDLLTGPDGAVYVVDWYDRRASHLDPRDTWDRTNGRIYKVEYHGGRRVEPFELARLSTDELIAFRTSPNDWYPSEARRILAERRDPAAIPALKALLAGDRDEVVALRDLWALHVSGGLDDATALGLLGHPVAGVRRWTVRLLGDDRRMDASLNATLVDLARRESDPRVRSQLASSGQRWKAAEALPILGQLLARDEDAADPQIPLLLWWALERQLRDDREGVVALIAAANLASRPLVRGPIAERVARALASGGTDADFRAAARLLAGPGAAGPIVRGLAKGLEGRRLPAVPEPLESAYRRLWQGAPPDVELIRLGVRLGDEAADRAARSRAADRAVNPADRLALIETIGQAGTPDDQATLLGCLGGNEPPAIRLAALNSLGGFASPAVAGGLVERYAGLDATAKGRALDLLCGRKAWARPLLDAVAAGQIPVKDLRPAQVLQVAQIGDTDLTARLEHAWGRVPRPNSPEKVRRVAEVRGMLVEGDKGDAARGRDVFREHCATCHRLFGAGEAIGPDLTGADRGDLTFLLTSVVDPSAVVRKEFEAQTVATADGRLLTGLVAEEDERTLTLIDGQRQRILLPRGDVEASKPSPVSLMPEGLLDRLPEPQVRDLFKYLQSSGPEATR